MRLLIIGALGGQIGAASQIAVARGSKVSQAVRNSFSTAAVEGSVKMICSECRKGIVERLTKGAREGQIEWIS